jgi:beta-phosphoglucomutase family hydrolase
MEKTIAVIFDMDGVLVNNHAFHNQAWMIFCEKYGIKISIEEIGGKFGGTNRVYLTSLFGQLTDEQIKQYAEEKEKIYRDIYASQIQLPYGLKQLLEELQANKIAMGVATSGILPNVDFVLDHTGIRKYFKCIIDDSMVSKGKPDPEIFLIAAKKIGAEPSRCVIFEDSQVGIQAGLNAGIKVIGITSTNPAEKIKHATCVINSFTEVNLDKIKNLIFNHNLK